MQKSSSRHTQHKARRRLRRPRRSSVVMFLGALAIVVVPLFWYAMSLGIGTASLVYAAKTLAHGKPQAALRGVQVGYYWVKQGSGVLAFVSPAIRLVGGASLVRRQERLVGFLTDVALLEQDALSVLDTGKRTAQSILAPTDEANAAPAVTWEKLRIVLASAHNRLGLAEAELRTLVGDRVFPFSLPPVAMAAQEGLTMLADARQRVVILDQLIRLYPSIAGFRRPQTYLVLLQNSMELRPTGGFIGSVGLARFEEGKLSDFSIQDVYALDGQLKGHVDPPLPIRELLGQEHWYLRDSNWDPDFSVSGAQAAWFYEKETGVAVDGVIGVSLPFVVDVLRASGPIELADYNDRITADNVYGKALFYTKSDFFPGSTQKKDFLGSLARALMVEVTTDSTTDPVKLFDGVAAALTRHDLLFSFVDPHVVQLVSAMGWAGNVPAMKGCASDTSSCMESPLAIVEANMSVNKASYLVTRSQMRDINISSDGDIQETVTLTYRNTGESTESEGQADAFVGKGEAYQMYLHMVLPGETSVSQITLDGVAVPPRDPKKKTPPPLPYVENVLTQTGVFTVGIAFTVPSGEERRLAITLTRHQRLAFTGGTAIFSVYTQKQPGMSGGTHTTMIRYPVYWLARDLPGAAYGQAPSAIGSQRVLAKEAVVEYNSDMTHDTLVRLQFQQ